MLISHKHKLVVFTFERTASQSIHSSLEHLFDVSIDGVKYRHINAEDFDAIIVPLIGDNYYKIAVVREPIQRCISFYNINSRRSLNPITFEDWWKENKKVKRISQYKQLTINNKVYLDRLFDFNHLNLFCNFIETIFNEKIQLKWFNKSLEESKPSLDIIEDMNILFKNDIILYKSIVDAGGELIINPYRSTP